MVLTVSGLIWLTIAGGAAVVPSFLSGFPVDSVPVAVESVPVVVQGTAAADPLSELPLLQLITLAALVILLGINAYLVSLVLGQARTSKQASPDRVQNTVSPAESQKILSAIEEIKRYLHSIESRLAATSPPDAVAGRSAARPTSGAPTYASYPPLRTSHDDVLRVLSAKIRKFDANGYTAAEIDAMVQSGEFQYFFKPLNGALRLLSREEQVRDKETFCGFQFPESGVFAVTFGRGLQQFRADMQRNPQGFSERVGEIFSIESGTGRDFRVDRPALLRIDSTGVSVLQKGIAVI